MAAMLKKRALKEYSAQASPPLLKPTEIKSELRTLITNDPEPLDLKTPLKKAKLQAIQSKSSDLNTLASIPPISNNFTGNIFTNKQSLDDQVDLLVNSQFIYGPDLSAELLQLFRRVLNDRKHVRNVPELFQRLLVTIRNHDDEFIRAAYVGCIIQLIAWPNFIHHVNVPSLLDEMLLLSQSVNQKLVVAEILTLIQQLIEFPKVISSHNCQHLIKSTNKLLHQSRSHLIKRKCLFLLSQLAPIWKVQSSSTDETTTESLERKQNNLEMATKQSECLSIIKTLRDYSNYFDSRVRSAALCAILNLHQRGIQLDFSLYGEFCDALKDDYEGCRVMAIRLLEVLSMNYPDYLVVVERGDEQIRSIDDAFGKICSMINDLSMTVRTQAASILGNFRNVSLDFLEQTLDKKLMSNLKLKKSSHERNRESCQSGEWATGRKWASDAPHEELAPETVTLMNIGACGAFIHGLEDEFMQVRMASLDSLCKLSEHYPTFAKQSLDFLVDMLNDEIEEIRLKAIFSLGKLGQGDLTLREDQVEIILPVLKDSSNRTRESLHQMLGKCKLSSMASVRSCIENLLENLKRYPEDRTSIWQCFQNLGKRHPEFTAKLIYDLLGVHSFFDLQEPSLDDHAYIAILILIVNAAALNGDIIQVFEKYKIFAKHYLYLRDSVPELVPFIKSLDKDWHLRGDLQPNETPEKFGTFLTEVFSRIEHSIAANNVDLNAQTSVIELSIQDLQRFGTIEPSLASAADFAKLYLQCQINLRNILSNQNWINAFLLPALQSSSFRSCLHQILQTTFRLIHQFHGLHPVQLSLVLQIRVKALALQLIAVIHGSNASALTLCDAFLEEVACLRKHGKMHSLSFDSLTERVLKEIGALHEPKPGSVARVLKPLFLGSFELLKDTRDITKLFSSSSIDNFKFNSFKKSYAVMDEPRERTETPLKFTSGLVLTLKVDAKLYNIKNIRNVRLKIHFADKQNHLVLPPLKDFRTIEQEDPNLESTETKLASGPANEVGNYRLQTSAYISHGVWSEPCFVELGLVLDFRETLSSSLSVSQTWSLKSSAGFKVRSEESLMIDLCKPVRILIAPKLHKKGLF